MKKLIFLLTLTVSCYNDADMNFIKFQARCETLGGRVAILPANAIQKVTDYQMFCINFDSTKVIK